MSAKAQQQKPLVLGIGNAVMGDDGVGLRVVEELESEDVSDIAHTERVGVDGFRVLARLRNHDQAILVDAISGLETGEVYVLTPDKLREENLGHSLHDLSVEHVLRMGNTIYEDEFPSDIYLVGIGISSASFGEEISEDVSNAVQTAVDVIVDILVSNGLDAETYDTTISDGGE
ncbi:hydrogenase maturation protease [Salinarchaeum sp. IM2453]|uniref:hydrogenase maturation protease n=1 Tax=Salinarchaeum sp. IM2453 TaxID=2862870 RepID=UPI001C83A868|nr:hydrogenase maturation protease [Salinarchaeum sp. IM2453]QZA88547.1 hydrogenase maturation protease [Salinarchaeum sp. IM2453]